MRRDRFQPVTFGHKTFEESWYVDLKHFCNPPPVFLVPAEELNLLAGRGPEGGVGSGHGRVEGRRETDASRSRDPDPCSTPDQFSFPLDVPVSRPETHASRP